MDLVEVGRIARAFDRWGERLVKRLLSKREAREIESVRNRVHFLARRFAVKEAAAKALGQGIAAGIRWADFELRHHSNGAPYLHLQGMAARFAAARHVNATHVSVADEKRHAMAFVIFCSEKDAVNDKD